MNREIVNTLAFLFISSGFSLFMVWLTAMFMLSNEYWGILNPKPAPRWFNIWFILSLSTTFLFGFSLVVVTNFVK